MKDKLYEIETARLRLRPWRIGDLNDFHEYASMPDVGPDAGWLPHTSKTESFDILRCFFVGDSLAWALVLRSNGKVIGAIGLRNDEKRHAKQTYALGYSLSHDYWGQGLMTEACRSIIIHAFDKLNALLLSCFCYPHNTRSRRVIEKCGFVYEGTLRYCSQLDSVRVFDDMCYSMTREEYESKFKKKCQ